MEEQGDTGGVESHEDHDEDVCTDTQLAELLSAMYYQTQLAIQVQMEDYAE